MHKLPLLKQNKGAKLNKNASLSDFQKQIIDFIEANASISYDEIAKGSGKDKTTVRRNIQKLKQLGFLERVGSRKTGHWKVLK
jgi:ATP-dependent DNA helicase RecG